MAVPCNEQELIDRIKALNPDKAIDVPSNGSITSYECIIPICNNDYSSPSQIEEFKFCFDLGSTFLKYSSSLKVFYSKTNDENSYTKLTNKSDYTASVSKAEIVTVNLKNKPPAPDISYINTFIKITFNIEIPDLSKINNEFAIQTSLGYTNNISEYKEIVTFKYPKYIIVPCTGEKLIDKIRILNPDKVLNVLSNGSIITCECIIPVCIECFDSTYLDYTKRRIHFSHFIDPVLFVYMDNSLEVFYSNDESNYKILDPSNYKIDSPNDEIKDYLNIFIVDPNECIFTKDLNYTYIKTKIKIKIKNVDELPDEFGIITNFAFEYEEQPSHDVWHMLLGILNILDPKYLIKKSNYSITALGCSLNTCKSLLLDSTTSCRYKEFTEDFTAKYSFNGINEEYENAYYVLTIKPSTGIEFPTTPEDLKKIKAYISINRLSSNIEIPNVADIIAANLIITIPYSEIYKNITQDITCTIINIYILVTIPYMIDNCILSTNEQNFTCIKGAIDFIIGDTTASITTYKTLASLDNFCSCINFNCPNLIGIGKNLLC